ncbi:hypothetical protein DL346_16805 [Paenibacillus montanisoli]|uniref:Uncharacterized protein n=1 Tax=Paenibacillus montanisoli TaxID=2081970 RepID=A0A328U0T0_9BACL|nr:hypothetical protein DL346_16805 [Paenibacillus montanisoli]
MVPLRCSESFFNKKLFAPFQLPELSVKEFIYLLFSSSHLNISSIVSNIVRKVNMFLKIHGTRAYAHFWQTRHETGIRAIS